MSLQEKARFVLVAVAMLPQQANPIYACDDSGGMGFCTASTMAS